jgi:YVTN family beta-propeller protein
MVKLSASRKKFILELFAVLVVCAFLATSIFVFVVDPHFNSVSNDRYESHFGSLIQTDNYASNYGYVKYTLGLVSNSLFVGNQPYAGNAVSPTQMAFDPTNDYLYVVNSALFGGIGIFVVNTETNKIIDNIPIEGATSIAYDSTSGYLYVASSIINEPGQIYVIDSNSNDIVENFTVATLPSALLFDPSNNYLYVAHQPPLFSGLQTVSIINTLNNEAIGSLTVGTNPIGLALDPLNGYIYVANQYSDNVSIIDSVTDTVIGSIYLGQYSAPSAITVDSSNGEIFITVPSTGNVSIISSTTNDFLKNITVGGTNPTSIIYNPFNRDIYVANEGSSLGGNVSIINTTNYNVIDSLVYGNGPDGLALNSLSGVVYVSDFISDNLFEVNDTNNNVMENILFETEPTSETFAASTGDLYVTDSLSGNVIVINVSTNKIVHEIYIGNNSEPSSITYDQANNLLYVADSNTGNITVINATTNYVVKNISLGSSFSPSSLTYDSLNHDLYVSDGYYSNTISVINGVTNAIIKNISFSAYSGLGPVYFDKLNGNIYAAGTWYLYTIDGYNNSLTGEVNIHDVSSISLDLLNGYLYLTNGINVSVLDTTSDNIIGVIDSGNFPNGLTFDPENNLIYIINQNPNDVSVVNGTNNNVEGSIPLESLQYSPDSTPILYVSNNQYLYFLVYNTGVLNIISTSNQVIPDSIPNFV